ncbi:KDGP aldolase [Citrobacter amalonaticus]|nr:KDGP aldolase [Citrobacter amalonaticus]
MQQINFYRQRVAINVLAKDIANAREIYDAAEGHAVIGVLSAQFSSVDEGVQEVKRWMAEVPSISVGLGGGRSGAVLQGGDDCCKGPSGPRQPDLYRQRFCGGGRWRRRGGEQTHINALVSPTGTSGEVLISTGVNSSQGTPAPVSCDAAVRMMQDMGAHAAKFFPMGGEKSLPELYVLASSAARNGMTLIEPTGGIDLDNFGVILQTCLEAGVPRVMPHVYSSIIDPQTGNTRPEDIVRLMDIVKALV